jgi:cytidylate kinase
MSRRALVVAVDGPGGSGKSTVSRAVAARLGIPHLDTGAFYRAATLAVLQAGAERSDEAAVLEAVAGRRFEQVDAVLLLDGVDVSGAIRSGRVTAAVSEVSAHPRLRALMVTIQREWVTARGGSAVVEGRDIGSVVFPEAAVKVFLTADPAERARRRAHERGEHASDHAAALARRDAFDATRAASPMLPAEGAVVIDTTDLGFEQVVEAVLALAGER